MVSAFYMYVQNLMCFSLFFIKFPRRKYFVLRFCTLVALGLGALFVLGPMIHGSNLQVITYYLIEFCMLMGIFHASFQTSLGQTLYCASAGRATQHLIYHVLRILRLRVDLFWWVPSGQWGELLESVVSYLPFCLIIYLIFGRKVDTSDYDKDDFHRTMNLLSVAILFICIVITRFAKGSSVQDSIKTLSDGLYAITCCTLCLIMQFEFYQKAKLTREMEMVRMLWKKDSKQLTERKDTIELINMKCHDIRHKLEDYHLPLTNDEEREIQSLINIYDQTYHTGSQTLDVLLADRALLCERDHIQLSFLGDGGCLKFLTESEVYSLFGNALGNAVEAARGVEEEKRQISVIVKCSGDLVSISVTNYYRGEIRFEEELPVTTSLDMPDFHGYGMKSMRAIAQKYGGKLKVKAEDGVFSLTIWLIRQTAA